MSLKTFVGMRLSHVSPPPRRVPKKAAEKKRRTPAKRVRKARGWSSKDKELYEGAGLKLASLECEIRYLEAQIDGLQAFRRSLKREKEVIEVGSSSEEEEEDDD